MCGLRGTNQTVGNTVLMEVCLCWLNVAGGVASSSCESVSLEESACQPRHTGHTFPRCIGGRWRAPSYIPLPWPSRAEHVDVLVQPGEVELGGSLETSRSHEMGASLGHRATGLSFLYCPLILNHSIVMFFFF